MSGPWSDTEVKNLRDLANNGFSASEIGEVLGFTRAAVIGKCHRANIQLKSTRQRTWTDQQRADHSAKITVYHVAKRALNQYQGRGE